MIKNVITTILSKVFQGFALKLGIQPGFNVNSGYSASAQGVSVSGSLSYMGINVKTIDFSVPVGLSYEYKNLVLNSICNRPDFFFIYLITTFFAFLCSKSYLCND